MITPGLYQRISTFAALAAIGDKWYPGVLPQGVALPAGVFFCVSRNRLPTHSGGGPYNARWQFDIYAEDYDQAEALAIALDQCLHGYKGTTVVAGKTYEIGASLLDNGRGPNFEPTGSRSDGPEPGLFRVSHDYKIWHKEVT